MYSKKIMRYSAILSCLIALHAYSVPRHFKRLVKFDAQYNIEKVVDLIGDAHVLKSDLVKNASKHRKSKLLLPDEKKVLAMTERTLLQTLREMAQIQRTIPILVLWEMGIDRQLSLPGVYIDNMDYLNTPFILIGGLNLLKEFNQNKGSIVVKDVDTYRSSRIFDLLFNIDIPEYQQMSALIFIKPLIELLDQYNLKVMTDINAVRKYATQDIAQELEDGWQQYRDTQLKLVIDTYINPYINTNKNITVKQLKIALGNDHQSLERVDSIVYNNYSVPIIEHEILFKIFGNPHKHIIVYAGATHTLHIQQYLTLEQGFKVLIDVGDDTDNLALYALNDQIISYELQLAPSAWKLLKNDPKNSVLAYRKTGSIVKKVHYNYWKQMAQLFSQSKETDKLTHDIEAWVKTGFQSHIDSPNSQLEEKPLLYIAIEKNWKNIAHLLLRYGANPNAYFLDNSNNEYISVLDLASIKNNQLLIDLLYQYGSFLRFK